MRTAPNRRSSGGLAILVITCPRDKASAQSVIYDLCAAQETNEREGCARPFVRTRVEGTKAAVIGEGNIGWLVGINYKGLQM